MAAPIYSSDLLPTTGTIPRTLATADLDANNSRVDAVGGGTWEESTDGDWDGGGGPQIESDFFIQGNVTNGTAVCTSAAHTYGGANQQTGTILYEHGTALSPSGDEAVMIWGFWKAGPVLDDYNSAGSTTAAAESGGIRFCIGTALNSFYQLPASGGNVAPNPLGGWYIYTACPQDATVRATVSSPVGAETASSNFTVFGLSVDAPSQSRGFPFAADAIRIGRCEQVYTEGEAADPANFEGWAAWDFDEDPERRFGLLLRQGGGYRWQGLMSIGNATTAAYFVDSNKNISVANLPLVTQGFTRMEVNQVTTTLDLTSVAFTSPGATDTIQTTLSRGQFEMVDNANVTFTGCSFTDMDTFIFQSNATLSDVTWRGCNTVTQGQAPIVDSTFEKTTAANALIADDAANVSSCIFTWNDSGIDNHAITLPSTLVSRTIELTGIDFVGYPSAGGGTANAMIYNDSGAGLVTINAVGCTVNGTTGTITVRNGTSATTVVNQVVSNTVTVTDVDGTAVSGAQVAAYLVSDDSQVFNGQTNGSGVATFTSAPSASMYVRVRLSTSGSTRYIPVETPASATATAGINLSVTLVEDLIASA